MDKAEVLSKLFNAANPQGVGCYIEQKTEMSINEAREIIDSGDFVFDYFRGRVLKINLHTDLLNTAKYNRDNGYLAAENALGI